MPKSRIKKAKNQRIQKLWSTKILSTDKDLISFLEGIALSVHTGIAHTVVTFQNEKIDLAKKIISNTFSEAIN